MCASLIRSRRTHLALFSPPVFLGEHSLMSRCLASVRALFQSEAPPASNLPSRIRKYDLYASPRTWARGREPGWYPLSRARRAIDREDWMQAEAHARQALSWDDT